jgi:hypothetical protein
MFGYTRFTRNGTTRAAIAVAGLFRNEFHLSGSRGSMLSLPVVLSADFSKAESGGPTVDDFNIASLGIGTGLHYQFMSQAAEGSVSAIASAQFASEGFGVGSGFSGLLLGEAMVVLRGLRIGDGIGIGYRFRYQTWSMSTTSYDYRCLSHGPFIGIAF